jgi:hypothetical protein
MELILETRNGSTNEWGFQDVDPSVYESSIVLHA